jgi:hypothetical protein
VASRVPTMGGPVEGRIPPVVDGLKALAGVGDLIPLALFLLPCHVGYVWEQARIQNGTTCRKTNFQLSFKRTAWVLGGMRLKILIN